MQEASGSLRGLEQLTPLPAQIVLSGIHAILNLFLSVRLTSGYEIPGWVRLIAVTVIVGMFRSRGLMVVPRLLQAVLSGNR